MAGRKYGGGGMPTRSEQEYRRDVQLSRERDEEERVIKQKAEAAMEKSRIEKLRLEVAKQKSENLISKRAALKENEEKEASERAERVKALLEAEKLIARQQAELKDSKIAELSQRRGSGTVEPTGAIGGGVKAAAMLHDIQGAKLDSRVAKRRSIADLAGFQAKIVNSQAGLDHDAEKRKVELDLNIGRLKLERDPLGNLYFINPQTGMTVIDLDPKKFGYTDLPEEREFQDNSVSTSHAMSGDASLVDFHKRKQEREQRRQISKDVENRALAFLASLADFNIKVPEIKPPRKPKRRSSGGGGGGPSRQSSLTADDPPAALGEGAGKTNPLFAADE